MLGIIETLKRTCAWHKELEDNGHIIDWTAVFLKLRMFSTAWYLYHKAIKLFPDFLLCEHSLAGTHSPAGLWAHSALNNSWRRNKVQMSEYKLIKTTISLKIISCLWSKYFPVCLQTFLPSLFFIIFWHHAMILLDFRRGAELYKALVETSPGKLCVGRH